jgi:hypothetical protein
MKTHAPCVTHACMLRLAEADELSLHHYQRLYEPGGCYTVVPATFILGKLPLMPDFGTPTIPHSYSKRQLSAFPHGKADSSTMSRDGSRLYYINHFGLTWSRSKLSMQR